LSFYEGVGVLKIEESESEVLKIEESESELLCTDSTALAETSVINQNMPGSNPEERSCQAAVNKIGRKFHANRLS
jgi:hypothetical protein